MIHQLSDASPAALSAFDGIVDVRSPGEFEVDHVPGAVNLPVLSNAERAEVGEIYVQDSKFRAGRIGAAYVASNIAAHLRDGLAEQPKSFRPLIYCWRGGQRSNAMAVVLAQVGWRTTVLSGGYKTYRARVRERLYDAETDLRLVLLDGATGSGKTEILGRLSDAGLQVIDLEGLAGHRGSLLGARPGFPQPSQKMFESRLLHAMEQLDPSRPVVVEAESSKIGERILPPAVWHAMAAAPRIDLKAPAPARATYLARTYGELAASADDLDAALLRLSQYQGRKRLEEWREMTASGAFEGLAHALVEAHYDPAYARSSRKDARPRLGVIEMADVSAASQTRAAGEIADLVSRLHPR